MAKLKTILDYYLLIFNLYPSISKSDIKKILQYGLKRLYLFNSYGGDVLINSRDFWFYCGSLMKDSLQYFEYYKRKMRVKLRVMYKMKLIPWDGYYYFALTKNLYDAYLALKNKKGRPKKNFIFLKTVFYKIYDECSIVNSSHVAIFRIPWVTDMGLTFYKQELLTGKAELILEREPLKFADLLLSNYNYQFIIDDERKNKRKRKNEQPNENGSD